MHSCEAKQSSVSKRSKYYHCLLLFGITMASTVTSLEGTSTASSFTKPKCAKNGPVLKLKFVAFDFDGTCTTKDTTSLYYKATKQYRNSPGNITKGLDKKWEQLGKFYYEGHTGTINRLLANLPAQFNEGLHMEELKKFLAEVYAFDSLCTKNVDDSGLLAGITREGLHQVAKQVELRPGCVNILSRLNLPLHIISFNWCEDLIKIVLSQLKNVEIVANNFQFHNTISRKYIGKNVSSPEDKENEFNKLSQRHSTLGGLTVYIGDSIGDILSLLKANIGIVIGNNPELREVSAAFGIQLISLSDHLNSGCNIHKSFCDIEDSNVGEHKGWLYETTSWNEIGDFLQGSVYLPENK